MCVLGVMESHLCESGSIGLQRRRSRGASISKVSRPVLGGYGFRVVSLQMLGEQILSCRRPLVSLAQVADVPWAMLIPFVATEALPLDEADITNAAPELPVCVARQSILAQCEEWCGDMTACWNRWPEVA
jgi:hypothetical protein